MGRISNFCPLCCNGGIVCQQPGFHDDAGPFGLSKPLKKEFTRFLHRDRESYVGVAHGEHILGSYTMKIKNKLGFRAVMAMLAAITFIALPFAGCKDETSSPSFHIHQWVNGRIITAADCDETGLQEQICSICGEVGLPIVTDQKHEPEEETGFCTQCGALGYKRGDTGPGGGIIYFVSEVGFTFYKTRGGTYSSPATDTTGGVPAHYLECAPADMPERLAWSTLSFTTNSLRHGVTEANSGTAPERAIGLGLRCTLRILDYEPEAPAAKACFEYTNNGRDDWFLPTRSELERLYEYKTYYGSIGVQTYHNYWASTVLNTTNAWDYDFTFGDNNQRNPFNLHAVRAIRAF